MSNNYTYSALPQENRSALCGHYGTQEQRDNWVAIDGYLIVDCGRNCDMATEHPDIKAACDAHSYSQDKIDVFKAPEAAKLTDVIATDEADSQFPLGEDCTQAEILAWQNAYQIAYDANYDDVFDNLVIDPSQLTQEQVSAFIKAYSPTPEGIEA